MVHLIPHVLWVALPDFASGSASRREAAAPPQAELNARLVILPYLGDCSGVNASRVFCCDSESVVGRCSGAQPSRVSCSGPVRPG